MPINAAPNTKDFISIIVARPTAYEPICNICKQLNALTASVAKNRKWHRNKTLDLHIVDLEISWWDFSITLAME